MPVVIHEITIHATLPAQGAAPENPAASGTEKSEAGKDMVQECAEQVMQMLHDKRER